QVRAALRAAISVARVPADASPPQDNGGRSRKRNTADRAVGREGFSRGRALVHRDRRSIWWATTFGRGRPGGRPSGPGRPRIRSSTFPLPRPRHLDRVYGVLCAPATATWRRDITVWLAGVGTRK